MESIWIKGLKKPCFPPLKGDIKTDVLIIGGGISGILTAQRLQRKGVDYLLAEANEICSGVSKNTTAKITFQHGFLYDSLIKKFGKEGASLYLKAHSDAVQELKRLCAEIDCDLKECDSVVYSRDSAVKAQREAAALKSLGANAVFTNKTELPFGVAGAVHVEKQAVFHPLKAIFAIAEGLNIYENTKVLELLPHTAITSNGKITAKKIIVATHFPFLNKHGMFFVKLHQERSYVLALENAPQYTKMYVDEAAAGLSFRNHNGTLLLGGGGHKTGKGGGCWAELESFAEKYYPNSHEAARWATQDCMSLDGMEYIGKYSLGTTDLYVATGYNKWGMSSAMVAAELLTRLVCGKTSPYEKLFSPSRSILHPMLFINGAESVKGLLTPTAPRCPHMGCALKYNREEHSWDCPCHGSRFSENGKLINNPATSDLRLTKVEPVTPDK